MKIDINKKQFTFNLAVVLMLIYDIIIKQSNFKVNYNVSLLGNILWALVIGLLLVKIIVTKYKIKELFFMSLVFVVCIISWRVSGEVSMLKFMFFTLAAKDINIEKTIKCFLITSVIFCTVVMVSCFIGIIPNSVFGVRFGRARYSIGFVSPSAFGYYAFNLSFILFLHYKKKINIRFIIVNIAALIVLWYVVNCKTAVIAIILLWALAILAKYKEKLFYNKFLMVTPALFGAVSLYFTLKYNSNNNLHMFLDNIMSLRISLQNKYYNIVGIHLWGHNVNLESLNRVFLDNSYMSLLLRFGVIIFIIVLLIYTLALKSAIDDKNVKIIVGIIVELFYAMSEMTLYSYALNIILFIVIDLVWNFKRNGRNKLYNESRKKQGSKPKL